MELGRHGTPPHALRLRLRAGDGQRSDGGQEALLRVDDDVGHSALQLLELFGLRCHRAVVKSEEDGKLHDSPDIFYPETRRKMCVWADGSRANGGDEGCANENVSGGGSMGADDDRCASSTEGKNCMDAMRAFFFSAATYQPD